MKRLILRAALAAFCLGVVMPPSPASSRAVCATIHFAASERTTPTVLGRTWIVTRGDNIVGLRESSQLSNPGVVDYDQLIGATEEMKKLEREGIDPKSPQGVQLKAKAGDRVAEAAERVRTAGGHCSVWKKIRHKDGRSVTDVTSLVLAEL